MRELTILTRHNPKCPRCKQCKKSMELDFNAHAQYYCWKCYDCGYETAHIDYSKATKITVIYQREMCDQYELSMEKYACKGGPYVNEDMWNWLKMNYVMCDVNYVYLKCPKCGKWCLQTIDDIPTEKCDCDATP